MLHKLHTNKGLQLTLGLAMGFCFGFLLQRGGVTRYDVILGQLLLRDWTVVKVILTAIVVGMLGIEALRCTGWVTLHKKPGALGSTVLGGLIFGAGFALLGYCPGTMAGASGQGSLDALVGGIPGMLAGAALFAILYPKLQGGILNAGSFGDITLDRLLRAPRTPFVLFAALSLGLLLYIMERLGF